MRGIWFHEGSSGCEVRPANLPFRPDGVKGSLADINARAVWLTRSPTPRDLASVGPHLSIVLSGDVLYRYASTTQPLGRGDFAYLDVASDSVEENCKGDAWRLLISVHEWTPSAVGPGASLSTVPRHGRPTMSWLYDDGGHSRTEPFRWPHSLLEVPEVRQWPRLQGGFVYLKTYPGDNTAFSDRHCSPRRQLAVTLAGNGANETCDGTRVALEAGDMALIEDTSGHGHLTLGQSTRVVLFLALAPGQLEMPREL